METIDCIFCHDPSADIVIRENGFVGRKCRACDLIYISPRPSYDEMMGYYSAGEGNLKYAGEHIAIKRSKKIQAKHILRLIGKYRKDGSLLELGAGAGHFLEYARRQGFEVSAIEPGTLDAEYIRSQGIDCETEPLHAESFDGKCFDIIYHCDLLGHLHDPITDFAQMRAKLASGGLLVFETGNLGEVDETQLRRMPGFQYPEHLFLFGERSIRALLDRTGFECLEVNRYSISLQFRLKRLLSRLEAAVEAKSELTSSSTLEGSPALASSRWSGGKRHARELWHSFDFLTRYKLLWIPTRLLHHSRCLQTLIVIARKN